MYSGERFFHPGIKKPPSWRQAVFYMQRKIVLQQVLAFGLGLVELGLQSFGFLFVFFGFLLVGCIAAEL